MKQFLILFSLIFTSVFAQNSYPIFLTSNQEKVVFPKKPEHLTKKLNPQMECSIYCANEKEITYLAVIIPLEQPLTVDQATIALEGFMSGILHNENNQLKSADLITVHQMPALEFNIESQNKHFQGRTIMCENHMILIAVEYQGNFDKEVREFIESYSLEKVSATNP